MGEQDFFISVDELAGRIGQPNLVVADGSWYLASMERDAQGEYDAGHIAGAVFFDIDAIADRDHDVPHMLPSAAVFGASCGALGISHTSEIIVYDGAGLLAAPRLWWTLKVMGAENVRILRGGLPAWEAAGHGTEAGAPDIVTREFVATLAAGRVQDRAQMLANVADDDVQIVDARPQGRFSGAEPEPREGLRGGHMPGAVCLPFVALVEDGQMISAERIAAVFAQAGIDMDRPVVTTCGSGLTAAVLSLGLEMLGHRDHRLYDGSWTEWGADATSPIVTG